jgi:Ca-activated chloride channel family protein
MRPFFVSLLALCLCASTHAAGLLVPEDENLPPLRITDHLVDVTIRDGIAITELEQTFHNATKQRLEATYVFPLPENADLTDFQMSFNGKMVQGEVLPAEKARQTYERIVRQMKDPGLIEFIGHRLLKMRVFPIEPESDTTIVVRYQQICRPISGMKGYHYPLRTRKSSGQAYGTVRFNLELETGEALKNIWSPTHAVEIIRDGEHQAKIAYEASGGSLNDDFMLLYNTDESDLGLSVVAHKPKDDADGFFVLMLTPKQLWPDQDYQPQDVVFVLDTSGSMSGDKIDQARSALNYCIEQLDERDRFSIVRFSTGYDVLWPQVKGASKEHRAEAREWVSQFSAAGGTNIADTLEHVVSMQPITTEMRPFVVVFLTDGRGNRGTNEIINRLADKGEQPHLRIFPFGVGHDVNTKLLDQLAEGYTGRPTYVQPGENLELVLGDFFAVISRPVLTNLRLALPDIGATERFPATLGDLYHGQQLILAGRFDHAETGMVKLAAKRGDETVEYSWPAVEFTHTPDADDVPAVWAGRKIAYLIDQIRRHGESTEMVNEILSLSQEYGIQTPYSSYLVTPGQTVTARGGMGAGGGSLGEQQRQLRGRGISGSGGGNIFGDPSTDEEPAADAPSRPPSAYGDEHGEIDLLVAGKAVTEESGEAANIIARRNAQMRDMRNRDDGRLDPASLPYQNINGRWYNRLGRFLVDGEVDEDTELIPIRFASEAYFRLVETRADLRPALAASTNVVVLVNQEVAVLVSDRVGNSEFSEAQWKQIES